MKQHVDLFPAHLRHQPVLLGALHAAYAASALVAVLLLVSLLVELRARRSAASIEALRADVAGQRAVLADLERTHPAVAIDKALADTTDALEQERSAKANVLALIASNELGNRGGFSSHLEALARHPVPGIWLEKIEIAAGGREVSLKGSTLVGARVPRLLQALGETDAFRGRSFHTLRMERVEEGPGHVRFWLEAAPRQDAEVGR